MAFRGRGRGRFSGGGFRSAKQEPFVLFPDIELPPIKEASIDAKQLVHLNWKFQNYVKDSPYFLEETVENKEEIADIERYSDKIKKRGISNRESILSCGYIILEPGYFPLELVQGTKRRIGRKVRWNPKRDLKKLDRLLEQEEKDKDVDPKSKKEKDGDDDEDDILEDLEEEDVDDDDDDYAQGPEFDDDDDDFNRADSGGEEDIM